MSRNSMAVIAGLIIAGSLVALLPAQESSRRTAPKNRPEDTAAGAPAPATSPPPATSNDAPAFAPAPDNPPIFQPPQALGIPAALSPIPPAPMPGTAPPPVAHPNALPPNPLAAPSQFAPPPTGAIAPPTGPVITEAVAPEDGQLHSVLKRSAPPGLEHSPPPAPAPAVLPSLPRPTEPSRSSSRRVPTGSAGSPAGPSGLATERAPLPIRSIQELAVTGKSPALRVDVIGPQGITVGKPASYIVNLVNDSELLAEEVMVRVSLPTWVTVHGAQPTNGEAAIQGDAQGAGRLIWNLPHVAARSQEQLRLNVVTSEGDGFDLGVEWKCKPASTRASIVVKQPKLQLTLAGPADMTFGDEKSFTLSVTNPGTGDADRVTLAITSGNAPPQQIDVGAIPAGFKKDLPLQVVASQPGVMELHVSASGEGGLEAETMGKITVRKAEVSVAVEGPPLKYAGTEAAYVVTVNNSGSAAADNVNLSFALPTGAKYLGGVDGAVTSGGSIKWKIASLAAGGERVYEVRLQLLAAGLNRVVVQSQANASGTADSQTETEVQAISDLKLVVNDPSGPLPTNEPAIYEVQVMNRGTQAAQRVKILMQFSSGIEPMSYEGCDARIVPGQVVCQPLVQLGAGEQVTLRVKAKGQQAGTHQFRVEVTTADGDARLVSEGTTRFFAENGRPPAAARTAARPAIVPGSSAPGTVQR